MQLFELIRSRGTESAVVALAAPALASILRTFPSQTADTCVLADLLGLLAAALEQQV